MFPKNLYAKMFAVKFVLNPDSNPDDSDSVAPTLDKPNQPLFIETGLIGESEVQMAQGHCLFSGLRFATTSYNHHGSLFFLVITVFTYLNERREDSQSRTKVIDKSGHPFVIASKISSPILVNSRKLKDEDKPKTSKRKRLSFTRGF